MEAPANISRALAAGFVLCALSAFSEPLKLVEQQIQIPERGVVTGYLVSVETNHFSFLPPPLWRTSHKPGGNSVAIMSPDLTSSINIEFIKRSVDEPAREPAALLKQRFPGASIGESFGFPTGLGIAHTCDLQRKAANNVHVSSRIAYVVTPWAIIEFALTTPAAKFEEHATTFAHLVNSFRSARQ